MGKAGIPVPEGGTFQGRKPPSERRSYEEAPDARLEERWSAVSRCDRTAEVTEVTWLTTTGTLRLGFEVTDGRPFSYEPGNFVRLETEVEGKGFRRGTYCIASTPSPYHRFDLLVRLVDGPMSRHLASLRLGDGIAFRGPTGRSMVRAAGDGHDDLVLVATGVGIAPLLALATTLLKGGWRRRIDLYWGLRRPQDVCLSEQLDRLAARYGNFRYRISLSQPPEAGWSGLTGRVTESVPPLLDDLEPARFFLTGNGAMTEELASALAEVGVSRERIYEEPYFNGRYVADRGVVAAIAARFPGRPA